MQLLYVGKDKKDRDVVINLDLVADITFSREDHSVATVAFAASTGNGVYYLKLEGESAQALWTWVKGRAEVTIPDAQRDLIR